MSLFLPLSLFVPKELRYEIGAEAAQLVLRNVEREISVTGAQKQIIYSLMSSELTKNEEKIPQVSIAEEGFEEISERVHREARVSRFNSLSLLLDCSSCADA